MQAVANTLGFVEFVVSANVGSSQDHTADLALAASSARYSTPLIIYPPHQHAKAPLSHSKIDISCVVRSIVSIPPLEHDGRRLSLSFQPRCYNQQEQKLNQLSGSVIASEVDVVGSDYGPA